MIVTADFSGFVDGHHLTWTLKTAGHNAIVDVNWNPSRPDHPNGRVTLLLPELSIPDSFAHLKRRYPSPMDGNAIRVLSVSMNGEIYQCSVHGKSNLDENPELTAFDSVWGDLSQFINAGSHGPAAG